MKKSILMMFTLFLSLGIVQASPIKALLERIDKGASSKFVIECKKGPNDFFELDQKGDKVVVRGNNYVNIAVGINWYLKYYAGIHLSWNCMRAKLPEILPAVEKKEYHETDLKERYAYNYCTHSYSMAFWGWSRWEQEIDWMALHGINMPLTITGISSVWKNVLQKLGYSKEEVNNFVAGPGYQAWWLMNNLEAWGGPNTDHWYEQQETLGKQIVKRMREYGIEPVFPGYSGAIPSNAKEKLGLDVADPGYWNAYRRPAFLQPENKDFERIAALYYKELTKLFGKTKYYSMDPFHEGGSVAGVDLDMAGDAIMKAMKKVNPKAVWVAQSWQACPYPKMIENRKAGDMLILDLFSESRPQWGDPESTWYRKDGFGQHGWIFCMLLNFGGNIGLHGKMAHEIDEFYEARGSRFNNTLKGVGITMEGIENNPVMFELLCELPWRKEKIDKDEWLAGYVKARYGKSEKHVQEAWKLLSNTIYNCPVKSTQQGTHESIFCARPSLNAYQVSSCSEMSDYYNPKDIIKAAGILLEAADQFKDNENYCYDMVDIVRQAIAEKGRLIYPVVVSAYNSGDVDLFASVATRFLDLIRLQDRLLATRSEFRLGRWTQSARSLGVTPEEKDWLEWNSRVLITTWGDRTTAEFGRLRDYAHREWNGLLGDFYYKRWESYFKYLTDQLNGKSPQPIDFYAWEEKWTHLKNSYSEVPEGDPFKVAKEAYEIIK